jgi:prepilin-type N-terminal cleavage/methylation domain-containing protein
MKKGMTLIEIIIAMAIMGIVMTLIGGLFSFSLVNYNIGIDQRDEQFAIRLASDFITDRVRYVNNEDGSLDNEVDVLSVVDDEAGFRYLYIEGNDLKYKDGSGIVVFKVSQIQNLTFTLRTEAPNVFLDFTITGMDGYQIISSVYFTNLKWADIDAPINGTVVKFK